MLLRVYCTMPSLLTSHSPGHSEPLLQNNPNPQNSLWTQLNNSLITAQCTQMQKSCRKIWYDSQHPFWCIIPWCSQITKSNHRTLLPWMATPRQTTNKFEWTYTHPHIPLMSCCCICCWGRTFNAKEGTIICLSYLKNWDTPNHWHQFSVIIPLPLELQMTLLMIHGNSIFWIADQVAQKQFTVHLHPDQENFLHYFTTYHLVAHHTCVSP